MNATHHHVSSYFFAYFTLFLKYYAWIVLLLTAWWMLFIIMWAVIFCLFYVIFYELMNINLLLTVWNLKKYLRLLLTVWAVRFGYITSFPRTLHFIALKNGYFTSLDCSPRELHKSSNLWYDIDTVKGTDRFLPWQQHLKAGCIRQRMFIQQELSHHSYILWVIEIAVCSSSVCIRLFLCHSNHIKTPDFTRKELIIMKKIKTCLHLLTTPPDFNHRAGAYWGTSEQYPACPWCLYACRVPRFYPNRTAHLFSAVS